MADQQTITGILDYYVNLLIIQYNNQPKARATIRLIIQEIFANGLIFDIRDAYDIETAVGKQLDVIGLYAGVDRFFSVNDPIDYFAFTDYIETDPQDDDKFGLTDYDDFEEFQHNGTLNYNSIVSVENRLSDDDYRVVINLQILQNNINHSHKEIDDGIFRFFENEIRPDSEGSMEMTYFISSNVTAIILAALTKEILPRPMGVLLRLIKEVSGKFYGFSTYSNLSSPHTQGFTSYSEYGTKEGKVLTYNQITVG